MTVLSNPKKNGHFEYMIVTKKIERYLFNDQNQSDQQYNYSKNDSDPGKEELIQKARVPLYFADQRID